AALFFAQITINIGMNMGLLPVTGITLPFISAGGSSLLASFLLAGIAESVIRSKLA
ncbi:MAG: FtsW/RodA/SpoVE family cell cycle protein, partial [Candidatus Magasanikbacteria bacterium]|nr:FtsW/RodA/SpoVE family cell cycle protein [Candidatus Magasanikbacteria bacterium]